MSIVGDERFMGTRQKRNEAIWAAGDFLSQPCVFANKTLNKAHKTPWSVPHLWRRRSDFTL